MINKNRSEFAVLFVDDEEKARKMFIRLVSPHFTVFTACDVKEAIVILEKDAECIGVLITDQRMPGQLGVELLRHVRKEFPEIIRLLTTAYSDLSDAIEAVNTGEIFRYINKPWNVDDLLIDLKLAMSFFTLQKDRQQLIHEKLSVSRHQTTTNSLKNLISIASGQTQYQQPLRAVDSLLQQLADPIACINKNSETIQEGYWVKEVQQTDRMIEINHTLGQYLEDSHSLLINNEQSLTPTDWQTSIDDLKSDSSNKYSLELTTETKQSHFSQKGLNQLFSAITQIVEPGDLSFSISSQDNDIIITSQTNTANTWLAQEFLDTSNSVANKKIAHLLGAFILVYHVGGNIKLGFDESTLNRITINLPKSSLREDSDNTTDIEGNLWVEDLFVLYS